MKLLNYGNLNPENKSVATKVCIKVPLPPFTSCHNIAGRIIVGFARCLLDLATV